MFLEQFELGFSNGSDPYEIRNDVNKIREDDTTRLREKIYIHY
ncbi:hypothetical protein [Bacillus marasmi]|nr:hypothetical protein [Bacillus marasmi]